MRFALVAALWRSLQAPELTTSRIERRLERSATILATITPSYLDPSKVTSRELDEDAVSSLLTRFDNPRGVVLAGECSRPRAITINLGWLISRRAQSAIVPLQTESLEHLIAIYSHWDGPPYICARR